IWLGLECAASEFIGGAGLAWTRTVCQRLDDAPISVLVARLSQERRTAKQGLLPIGFSLCDMRRARPMFSCGSIILLLDGVACEIDMSLVMHRHTGSARSC